MQDRLIGGQTSLETETLLPTAEITDRASSRRQPTQVNIKHTLPSPRAQAEIGFMPPTKQVHEQKRENHSAGDAGAVPMADAVPHRDVLNRANFGLLPEERRRLGSFGVAAGVNAAIAALILALTVNQVHEAYVHRQEQLVYVAPPPKPYVPPVPKIQLPPIPPLPREEAKIPPPPVPKPTVEPPKVELPKAAAKAPAMPAPVPRPVVTPPRPVLGTFKSPEAPAQQAPRVAAAQAAGFWCTNRSASQPQR